MKDRFWENRFRVPLQMCGLISSHHHSQFKLVWQTWHEKLSHALVQLLMCHQNYPPKRCISSNQVSRMFCLSCTDRNQPRQNAYRSLGSSDSLPFYSKKAYDWLDLNWWHFFYNAQDRNCFNWVHLGVAVQWYCNLVNFSFGDLLFSAHSGNCYKGILALKS